MAAGVARDPSLGIVGKASCLSAGIGEGLFEVERDADKKQPHPKVRLKAVWILLY